jgi:hypothetical protein
MITGAQMRAARALLGSDRRILFDDRAILAWFDIDRLGCLTPPANVGLSESLVLGSRTSSRMYQRSRSSRPQSQARR